MEKCIGAPLQPDLFSYSVSIRYQKRRLFGLVKQRQKNSIRLDSPTSYGVKFDVSGRAYIEHGGSIQLFMGLPDDYSYQNVPETAGRIFTMKVPYKVSVKNHKTKIEEQYSKALRLGSSP